MRPTRLIAGVLFLIAVMALAYSVWKGMAVERRDVGQPAAAANVFLPEAASNPSVATATTAEMTTTPQSSAITATEEPSSPSPILNPSPAATSPEATTPSSVDAPTTPSSLNQPSAMTLFYGNGCSHCANVEAYLAERDISALATVTRKEVFDDQDNQRDLANQAAACGIPLDQIGVPLLWTGQECLKGDAAIIDYFNAKIAPRT